MRHKYVKTKTTDAELNRNEAGSDGYKIKGVNGEFGFVADITLTLWVQ